MNTYSFIHKPNKLAFSQLLLLFIFILSSISLPAIANIKQQNNFSQVKQSNLSFVGSKHCANCHPKQTQAWQGSHHDMAMRHATPEAVQADFNNTSVEFNGKTNRFFKKGPQFWVNIEGADGKFHDYQIKYTFGYQPLQQYMVEFNDGRVQLIPFAWDTRPNVDGGQRWFHLYPEYTEKHQDFFWTNSGQNWNYMCADCHSTDVRKNFDQQSNSYNTTYSEINVACEACHGAASKHLAWSKNKDNLAHIKHFGFDRNLSKQVNHWINKPSSKTLQPESISPSQQVDICGQCHSRHVQISNTPLNNSNTFGERYLLSLIESPLYYPDGQVYDEDFVYGSFLQSKMAQKGVVCSNCHDPHSAKLTLPKKQLCVQCHQAQTYNNKQHHQHQENSAGAQCINCHMPETTYMTIDDRRDHGWHLPRPDLAKKLASPDVCLSCHEHKDSNWSSQMLKQWQPLANWLNKNKTDEKHFAPVFAAADNGYSKISSALSHIAQSKQYAPIIRASALSRMNLLTDTNSLIAIARAVKHQDANIRLGAIAGAEHISAAERWRVISPLLFDKVLAVRSEAARILAPLWQQLTQAQQKQLQGALNDYLNIQSFNADRGFSHVNKGNILRHQGQLKAAEQSYLDSIRIEPLYARAYIYLSAIYRLQKKEQRVISILKQGIAAKPDEGELFYQLALAYIRQQQRAKAISNFKKASLVSPKNANFYYVYGISIQDIEPDKAQQVISKAYKISNNPQHLYTLCDIKIKHKSLNAKQCLKQLESVVPEGVFKKLEQQLIPIIRTKNNE